MPPPLIKTSTEVLVSCNGTIIIREVRESESQGVRESGSQGVRESDKPKRSSEYSRVTLEIFQVRPIITKSVRGDRRGVHHDDHGRTNGQ